MAKIDIVQSFVSSGDEYERHILNLIRSRQIMFMLFTRILDNFGEKICDAFFKVGGKI